MFTADFESLLKFSADKLQKVNLYQSHRMFADLYCLMPGQAQRIHSHAQNDKMYFVLRGTVTCTCGTECRQLSAGESCFAPAEVAHGIENASQQNAVVLVAMAPNTK